MQFFRKKLNKKGFTLIELIVVIAILAILAAIAVPRLLGFQDRAREQADKQSAVQIRNALGLLHANGEIELATGTTGAIQIPATDSGTMAAGNLDEIGTINTPKTTSTAAQLVFELVGAFDKEGKKAITVEIGADGTVTVVSP